MAETVIAEAYVGMTSSGDWAIPEPYSHTYVCLSYAQVLFCGMWEEALLSAGTPDHEPFTHSPFEIAQQNGEGNKTIKEV